MKRDAEMNVHCIPAARLPDEHWTRWSHLLESHRLLDGPFFRPELARAVARVRDDVEVAVLETGGDAVGFLPFHRRPRGIAKPLGLRLSDFQGVVAREGLDWSPESIVRGCGLRAWHFDHLLAPKDGPHCRYRLAPSAYLALEDGYEAYVARRRASGSSLVSQILRKRRKLARERGPIRFEAHTTDPMVFESLLRWKSERRRQTRTLDVLQFDWVVRLLDALRREETPSFAGLLSALYAGDRLVAAHLGLRSERVLHFWFPAFDREQEAYSPGLIHLLEMARWAADRGFRRFDLGKGEERFKLRLMSDAVLVGEGSCDLRVLGRAFGAVLGIARACSRTWPLRVPARMSSRILARLYTARTLR